MDTIKVSVRNVYGNDLIYPVCDRAQLFARLARTTTLRPESVHLIQALGYEVVQVNGSELEEVLS